MRRLSDESGFTLTEMLVGLIITLLVFSGALALLVTYQNENQYDLLRNQVQDSARTTIDRMTLQLRNVAAESPTAAGALERAGPYDMEFQTVNPSTVFGGSNATNQMRVRYCLDTSTPVSGITPSASNSLLLLQTQTWTSAAGPAIPADGGACPGSSSSGWTTTQVVVTNITNTIHAQSRPVFSYAPIGATAPAQINSVDVDLFLDVNPGKEPGESEMKSGIYLRNSFAAPVSSFTIDQSTPEVKLDGSDSFDANGQALSYQWSVDGNQITGATSQMYDAGPRDSTTFPRGSQHTFTLTVTSTGGLSNSSSQTVTIL